MADHSTRTNVHRAHAWEYANAAARTGATGFVAADVYKLALQTDTNALYILTATTPTWVAVAGAGGTGAATTDHFVTTQAETDLSAEFNLGSLTSGMLKHTVSGSVSTPATATEGTDYYKPGGTDVAVADGGTGASTLTANNVILGNGTSAVQFVAPGSSGNVLTSNGTTWASSAPAGGGSSAYARVYNAGNLTVNSGASTVLTFDSETNDTSSFHDTSSNTGRLTAPATGQYRFTARVAWDNNTSGIRQIWFRLNGTTVFAGYKTNTAGSITDGSSEWQDITAEYPLSTSDYVEVMAYQDSGTARTITGGATGVHFTISQV